MTAAGTQGNDTSSQPSIAASGSHVAFSSYASNLVSGDTNDSADVFVTNLSTGSVVNASVAPDGSPSNRNIAGSTNPSLSGNGNAVAFSSFANNLLGGDSNQAAGFQEHLLGRGYVLLPFAMLSARTTLSVEAWFKTKTRGPILGQSNIAPPQPETPLEPPSQWVSALYVGGDGRLRGQFWNGSANPIVSAAPVNDGIWHHVALTVSGGNTQRLYLDGVLQGTRTGQINHLQMHYASVGRAFMTNWPGAALGGWRTFDGKIDEVAVYWGTLSATRVAAHVAARTTAYRSAVLADAPAGYWRLGDESGTNVAADASPHNRWGIYQGIVFRQPGALTVDGNDTTDVFLRNLTGGTTERIPVGMGGAESDGLSSWPDMSPDGRWIAFQSDATNLVQNDTNGRRDIFLRDRQSGQTIRVSTSSAAVQANGDSSSPVLTPDGRYVAFASEATNLVGGDTNGWADVFVKDTHVGTTTRVSVSSSAGQANSYSLAPAISADGRFVAFISNASNLVPGDTNGANDVFVHDRQAAETTRVSVSSAGEQSNSSTLSPPAISADGRFVAFASNANNLVPGDTNGATDVFLHDRESGETRRVSTSEAGVQGNGNSVMQNSRGTMSADGKQVAFASASSNLVSGDTNGAADIFVSDDDPPPTGQVADFMERWLPRVLDEAFILDWLALPEIPQAILNEGFHSLTEPVQRGLVRCIADEYMDEFEDLPAELVEGFTAHVNEALFRLIFDKDNLLGDEDTRPVLPSDLLPPVLDDLLTEALAPLPDGPLPNLLGPGPLFTPPLLSDNLLFDTDPVAELQGALAAFVPPRPPIPDLSQTLASLGGAITGLGNAALLYELLGTVTYSVRVERFSQSGDKLGEFTLGQLALCVPVTLSSETGVALPLEDHDLRITLCPDPLSILGADDQRLTIAADALGAGVRVKLTFELDILLGLGGQLQATVDSSTTDLPVETGEGSPGFPCADNGVVPPVWPPNTPETDSGFCVELVANGADPTNVDSTITTYASGPTTGLTVRLNELIADNLRPVGELEVVSVPQAMGHRFLISAQRPASGDEVAAQVALTNAQSPVQNPGETFIARLFDTAGDLDATLTISDLPEAFDSTLAAGLDAGGAPRSVELTGTSTPNPDTTYRLDQYGGEATPQAFLEITSFAAQYAYHASIVQDASGTYDVGFALQASFPQGPPQGAELRFEDIAAGRSALFREFATSTTFTATADNPDDPSELNLETTNSDPRPNQVIRIVQDPPGGAGLRMLLAGDAADIGEFVDPEEGLALRWTDTPASYQLDATLAEQEGGELGSATFDINTLGTEAPLDGRLELKDHRDPSRSLHMTIVSPSPDQHLKVTAEGPLNALTKVGVDRKNRSPRPNHALQIAALDSQGVGTRATFLGPSASSEGLIAEPGRDIEAMATDLPEETFVYEVDIDFGDEGAILPAEATITGETSPAGTDTTIEVEDHNRNFRLLQQSLPETFTYKLQTKTDTNIDKLTHAAISGSNQSSAMPTGLIEIEAGPGAATFGGFAQSFDYVFDVEYDTNRDPTALGVHVRQSDPNPQMLVQLAFGEPSAPDFVLSLRNPGVQPRLVEAGSQGDLLMVNVPQDLNLSLDLGSPASGQTAATAHLDAHGTDLPHSTLRVRRQEGDDRQELRARGLSPEFRAALTLEGALNSPEVVQATFERTTTNPGDVYQILLYEDEELATAGTVSTEEAPSLPSQGGVGEPGPFAATGERGTITFEGLPQGLELAYENRRDPGQDHRERLAVDMQTYNLGASLDDHIPHRTGGTIRAALENRAALDTAREFTLENLPAEVHLDYLGPHPDPTTNIGSPTSGDSCIGDIGYAASDSGLHLELRQFMGPVYRDDGNKEGDGCFPDEGRNRTAGSLDLRITDVPSQGFETATLLRDGTAIFRTCREGGASCEEGGERQPLTHISVDAPMPDWLAAFVNKNRTGSDSVEERICEYGLMCMYIEVEANPHFLNPSLQVDATSLTDIEVATNIGDPDGLAPDPPQGGTPTQEFLWDFLPILGVKNNSSGEAVVKLNAEDDPEEDNEMTVSLGCCLLGASTNTHEQTIPFDAYGDLQVAFYGWDTRELEGPGEVGKFNRDDQQIRGSMPEDWANLFHPGHMLAPDWSVPFGTRFIEYRLAEADGSFDTSRSNSFVVPPESVSYFMPNLFDLFAADPKDGIYGPDNVEREGWYGKLGAGELISLGAQVQTNWYWYLMLHLLDPDPHGLAVVE